MRQFILKDSGELAPLLKGILDEGRQVRITVTGNSMFPLFSHMRDSVVLKKQDQYRKYDIILYTRENGGLVLHRIVSVGDGFFSLCGDNQSEKEYPVYPKQIMARVTAFTRKGKDISVNHFLYRIYFMLWCLNLKVRHPILQILLKIKRFSNRSFAL